MNKECGELSKGTSHPYSLTRCTTCTHHRAQNTIEYPRRVRIPVLICVKKQGNQLWTIDVSISMIGSKKRASQHSYVECINLRLKQGHNILWYIAVNRSIWSKEKHYGNLHMVTAANINIIQRLRPMLQTGISSSLMCSVMSNYSSSAKNKKLQTEAETRSSFLIHISLIFARDVKRVWWDFQGYITPL